VYSMRMARVNITVPDELLDHARAAGLNVSRLAAAALVEELDRRAKVAALDAYLAEQEAEFGPAPASDLEAAAEWADRLETSRPAAGRAGSKSREARSA
jgi:post-segregation antitoxin (ccd killing protein)